MRVVLTQREPGQAASGSAASLSGPSFGNSLQQLLSGVAGETKVAQSSSKSDPPNGKTLNSVTSASEKGLTASGKKEVNSQSKREQHTLDLSTGLTVMAVPALPSAQPLGVVMGTASQNVDTDDSNPSSDRFISNGALHGQQVAPNVPLNGGAIDPSTSAGLPAQPTADLALNDESGAETQNAPRKAAAFGAPAEAEQQGAVAPSVTGVPVAATALSTISSTPTALAPQALAATAATTELGRGTRTSPTHPHTGADKHHQSRQSSWSKNDLTETASSTDNDDRSSALDSPRAPLDRSGSAHNQSATATRAGSEASQTFSREATDGANTTQLEGSLNPNSIPPASGSTAVAAPVNIQPTGGATSSSGSQAASPLAGHFATAPNTAGGISGQVTGVQPFGTSPALTALASTKTSQTGPATVPQANLELTNDPVLAALSSARLRQSLGRAEMDVHFHAEDLGRISVHAAYGPDSISAQITLQNHELSSNLAAHLPALEQKLAGEHGPRATVTIDTQSTSTSQGGAQGRGQHSSADTRSPSRGFNLNPNNNTQQHRDTSALVVPAMADGLRLDIHI